MDLAEVDFTLYVGGQVEVRNSREDHVCQGAISAIRIDHNPPATLVVELEWMAQGRSLTPEEWFVYSNDPWAIILSAHTIADIGEGQIAFYSGDQELIVLHPQGGYAIDPSQVIGL